MRLTFTAQHPDDEIERLAEIVRTRILARSRQRDRRAMSAVFVTATGTDIGKTFVTAGLIRHFRAAGRAVDAIKPVVSGFDPDALAGQRSRPCCSRRSAVRSRWRRSSASRPGGSRRRSRRTWPRGAKDRAHRRSRRWSSSAAEPWRPAAASLLIEGIGGIMVPLDDRRTVLDWMSVLRIPIILVAGSYVGTISQR